jgi:hypothetical protein
MLHRAAAANQAQQAQQPVQTVTQEDDDSSVATAPVENRTSSKVQKAMAKKKPVPSTSRRQQVQSPAPFQDVYPPRRHVAMYSLKINLERAPDGPGGSMDTLVATVGEIVNKFRKLDDNLIFYPYLAEHHKPLTNHLLRLDQLKKEVKELQRFFFNMTPRKNGGNLYIEVLMGSSKSWDDLSGNIDYWLKENKHGMWLHKLQQEKVLDVGWLLFFHSNLNHRALASTASDMLGFDVNFLLSDDCSPWHYGCPIATRAAYWCNSCPNPLGQDFGYQRSADSGALL